MPGIRHQGSPYLSSFTVRSGFPALITRHASLLSFPFESRDRRERTRLERGPPGGMERVNREDDKPSGNPSQTVPEGEEPTREASVRLGHKTLRTWMKNSSLW